MHTYKTRTYTLTTHTCMYVYEYKNRVENPNLVKFVLSKSLDRIY